MGVDVTLANQFAVKHTVDQNADMISQTDNTVTYDGLNLTKSLSAGSTPPATQAAICKVTLTAADPVGAPTVGTARVDLTAISGTNGGLVNGTGLKVRALKLKGKSTNTAAIVATKGSANGYVLGGTAPNIPVSPNADLQAYYGDDLGAVGPTAKNIDFAGVTGEIVFVGIVFG